MKKIFNIILVVSIPCMFFSQVVITDKATPALDNTAVLKLDSDKKGFLLPRIPLTSNMDATTVLNPQNGNIVFNTNSTSSLPQTVTYFEVDRWNAVYTKDLLQPKLDVVNSSSVSSTASTTITGFTPGAINLGSGITGWVSLGVTDSKTITRIHNSFAFTVEGMTQLDASANEYYEYAIGVFVDDVLVVVRKYHKQKEDFTCSWNKFILNGVVNNLSIGNHSIKVMARNISSTSNLATQKIVYAGAATRSDGGTCDNMSSFLAKISLNITVVESIN
ncbi:hypothetical protein LPB90_02890 [Chryseobacterium sp. LC2016-29]|uniref:hypothetical protein n=1 Tax=Chryseobacterium sp. LC2016-29 TaxID=2897331 RepID=UPI001E501ACA|nr:hypothetical protein [Chryseobacterium sp. LC2016-29]MCD0477387.1 hypothetical protein [Chryseobacterium sp. LC2016-29]